MTIAHPAHTTTDPTTRAGDPFIAASRSREYAERLTREERGIQLFEERGDEIQQIGRGLYSVPSCTGRGDYLVRYSDTAESCSCRDFQFGHVCKHQYAVAIFAAHRRKAIRTRFAPVLADGGVGDE